MIDRKAFWISGGLLAAMLAATLWRIALLPDWTEMPRYGEGGVAMPPVSSLWLMAGPGVVIFMALLMVLGGWVSKASDEDRRPWRKWRSLFLVTYSVIVALMQVIILMRSLGGASSLSPVQVARTVWVLLGIMMIVMSNQIPKLPWLASRIGILNLDSESGARLLRIRGRIGVAAGFAVALFPLVTPTSLLMPVMLSIAALTVLGGWVVRFRAGRGQTH